MTIKFLLLLSGIVLFAQIVEPNCVDSILDDPCRLQLRQWKPAGNYFGILWTLSNQLIFQILHHLLHTKDDHIVVFFDVELPKIAPEEARLFTDAMS